MCLYTICAVIYGCMCVCGGLLIEITTSTILPNGRAWSVQMCVLGNESDQKCIFIQCAV